MKKTPTARELTLHKLNKSLEISGLSPSILAKKIGVSPSTVNRFFKESKRDGLSQKTMLNLDSFVNDCLKRLEDTEASSRWSREYFGYGTSSEPAVFIENLMEISVRGEVQAGAWKEAIEAPVDEWEKIYLPKIGNYQTLFGLKVCGNSMNLIYPEGSYLICTPIHFYKKELSDGDHVIVQRIRDGEYEATVKEFRIHNNGDVWLWPKSSAPEHQEPIKLPQLFPKSNGSENTKIEIVAVVVADYRIRNA